jgi:hypothetical protein
VSRDDPRGRAAAPVEQYVEDPLDRPLSPLSKIPIREVARYRMRFAVGVASIDPVARQKRTAVETATNAARSDECRTELEPLKGAVAREVGARCRNRLTPGRLIHDERESCGSRVVEVSGPQ